MENIFTDISLVVMTAAILSVLAFITRQPVIMAYIGAGMLLGPSGLGRVENVAFLDGVAKIGITMLLFLAGLELQPREYRKLLGLSAVVTLGSSVIFSLTGFGLARLFGFSVADSLGIGLVMIFSSTILVVKLLPTIQLHQKHMGAICISILIMQDLVAVAVLAFLGGQAHGTGSMVLIPLYTVLLVLFAYAAERYVLRYTMKMCQHFHETLYLVSLGWCLGFALLAKAVGLSAEVGAFVAGLSLARSPLSAFLFEGLKFFRDFFLVLFFFVLGAQLNFLQAGGLWIPSLALALLLLVLKPVVFRQLLYWKGERNRIWQTGIRLGQNSTFALIIAALLLANGQISGKASLFIQLTTIFTMIISSYIVVLKFPSPMAISTSLKQD